MQLADRCLKALMYRVRSRWKAKHVRAFLRYNSPAKMWNLARVAAGIALRSPGATGWPVTLGVETTNLCNLECPLCPTGRGEAGRRKRSMTLHEFEHVLDQAGRYAYVANLQNWGEPLLTKDIVPMIAACHERRIFSTVSTNGNYPPALNPRLVDAHLDQITFAVDGSTQEIYERYRVGGRLELVLRNMQELLRLKEERGVDHPFVEMQFLVFDHNREDVPRIRALAEELGVDGLLLRAASAPGNRQNSRDYYDWDNGQGFCDLPWRTAIVSCDGGVIPCCRYFDKPDDLGNMFEAPFQEAWNGATTRRLRAAIARGERSDMNGVCGTCPVFGKAHHAPVPTRHAAPIPAAAPTRAHRA